VAGAGGERRAATRSARAWKPAAMPSGFLMIVSTTATPLMTANQSPRSIHWSVTK
jgi:hypothetical protein